MRYGGNDMPAEKSSRKKKHTEGSAPAHIAILLGEDTISLQRVKQEHIGAIDACHDHVEKHSYDPDQQTISQLVEAIITPSLFQSTRIFVLRHISALSAPELEELGSLMNYDIPDAYLIMESESAPQKGKAAKDFAAWLKKLDKRGGERPGMLRIEKFPKPPDYKIADWLVTNTPAVLGRRISRQDAEHLVDLVGSDFAAIHSEIQKLDIYLPEGAPITGQIIAEVIEGSRAVSPSELAQALGHQDMVRVLEIIDSLFAASFYPPPCIAAVFRHFSALYRVRTFFDAHPQAYGQFQQAVKSRNRTQQNKIALAAAMAGGFLREGQQNRLFPVIIKPRVLEQAQRFDRSRYRAIFGWLRDFDVGIKTGRVESSKRAFQLLCYRIVRG